MEHGETKRPGLMETLRRLGDTVLTILHNRLELLAVELHEERLRAVHALILTAVVVVLGFLTVTTALVALLIIVWNNYGVSGLFVASGVGLVVTLLAYWWLREQLRNWPFLSGTLGELKKDRECLKTKN